MAGAMSPDLIYFLMADTSHRGLSHSWPGLFQFCLPAGILFTLAFQWLVKRPLILNCPHAIVYRIGNLVENHFRLVSGRDWLILISSVLIGALSHFFWDAATHGSGEIVRMFPVLTTPVDLFGFNRPVYRLLQHLSSLFGLIFIPWYLLKTGLVRPATRAVPEPNTYTKLIFWGTGLVCGLVVATIALELYEHNVSDLATFGLGVWAGFFWWSCLYSLVGVRFRIRHLIQDPYRQE